MLAIYTYIQVHVYIVETPKANGILGLDCLVYEKTEVLSKQLTFLYTIEKRENAILQFILDQNLIFNHSGCSSN